MYDFPASLGSRPSALGHFGLHGLTKHHEGSREKDPLT